MEEYVKKLRAQLEEELGKIDPEKSSVKGHDQRVKLIKKAIGTLKSYLKRHPLKNAAEYAYYFKHLAPLFYQPYIYYTKLYNLELTRISSPEESLPLFIEEELKAIDVFYQKNEDFCRYYYMGATFMDEQLFTPGIPEN